MATNNAINTASLTNGELWIGSTGASPTSAVPTSSGSTISITTGAGSLNFDLAAPVTVPNGGTGLTTITAHGILVGEGTSAVSPIVLTNGELLIGSTGADPVATTITAGSNITVTNGAGTITIASSSATLPWNNVTSTTQTVAVANGYTASNAGFVTFTLPATAAYGSEFEITTGSTAGGWTLAQAAGQSVHFGNAVTTAGTGGSLASTARGDTIKVLCIVANTTFQVLSSVGNITVV